jgi:hypothetical protein
MKTSTGRGLADADAGAVTFSVSASSLVGW